MSKDTIATVRKALEDIESELGKYGVSETASRAITDAVSTLYKGSELVNLHGADDALDWAISRLRHPGVLQRVRRVRARLGKLIALKMS
jgi:hypothetical protein